MIDPMTGAGLAEALAGINAALQGQTLDYAYNDRMTDRFDVDDGPQIGYGNWTQDKPSISGDTSGSISTAPAGVPIQSWGNYIENTPGVTVSETTGGAVSGSKIGTFVYSLMEEHPGTAQSAVKAVATVGVPIATAVTAISQAIGVSIKYAELGVEVEQELKNAILSSGSAIYDEAKGLVTAWKDEWGRILFPKSVFDSLYDKIIEFGWGSDGTATSEDFPNYVVPISDTAVGKIGEATVRATGAVFSRSPDGFIVAASRTPSSFYGQYFTPGSHYPDSPNTEEHEISYPVTINGLTVYIGYYTPTGIVSESPAVASPSDANNQTVAWISVYGTITGGEGYPDGASESGAQSYDPNTIPIAGNLATSYNPDTEDLETEPLVPIHIPDNPEDATGDVINPTEPTEDDNPGVLNPPVPMPIPDTNVSNPDVPLVNSSVVDSTLVNELVEELASTLDPQAPQSSGVIPFPPMPGIVDPDTGQSSYPSIIPASGPGFIHVYNPTPGEFVSFGNWLWVTYADATIDKILNNPFDGVIGAHELYATPQVDGSDNIRSAFLTSPVVSGLVRQRYTEIDCGTVVVPEFYGNYLDYSPYSQAYIYLPFIGINEVSIDDIVGHAVNIKYRVDAYSGSCIAMIFVAKGNYQNLCYQFAGNCAVEVPMAGGSQAAIKAAEMQAEAYARAAMVSAGGHLLGGIGSALMGSLGGAISSIGGIAGDYANAKAGVEAARVANKSSVQHSGQFGASHGAMGEKIPFIIIRNPIQVKVVNYNEDYGFPAHKRVIVGGCRGYLRVREVNVISAHATDDEKAAIEALLKNGVYVS